MTSPLALAAADYLARGLPVIALTGKTPNVTIHRRGLTEPIEGAVRDHGDHPADSYTYSGCPGCEDRKLLDSVFEHPATTGVAIVIPYPYVVVDIDGEDGAQQWRDLLGRDGHWAMQPDTWVAATARGLHMWFTTEHATGTIKLGPKLDLKGQGGYVVAPPSVHPDGPVYRWLSPPDGLGPSEAPPELVELIVRHAQDVERIVAQAQYKRAFFKLGDQEYGTAPDFSGILKKMAEAEEGNRNAMLFWAARSLADEDASETDFDALRRVALEVGLTPIETRRTIRSAIRG